MRAAPALEFGLPLGAPVGGVGGATLGGWQARARRAKRIAEPSGTSAVKRVILGLSLALAFGLTYLLWAHPRPPAVGW